eukprot:5316971-Pyramimonas_sp.AAC.1
MPIFRELARGDHEEEGRAFSYPQFLAVLKKEAIDPQIREHIVPCPTRHSEPSMGNARRCRTIAEMQERGQRRHAMPMQRYVRTAKLGQSRPLMPSRPPGILTQCELHLEGILLGKIAETIRKGFAPCRRPPLSDNGPWKS